MFSVYRVSVKAFALFLVVTFVCFNSLQAQEKSVATPASKRASELIQLINGADLLKFDPYITANFSSEFLKIPLEAHRDFLNRLYDEARKLNVYSITEPKPSEAVVLYQAELTQEWRQLIVSIEEKEPYKITGIRPRPGQAPADKSPKPTPKSEAEIVKEIDSFTQRLAAADVFSGGVLIAKDGKVLFKKAYGEASKEFGVPNQVTTRFINGSINKMFTSTAILQLVEAKKVSLEDFVSQHLPGVLKPSVESKIKIKHLLTHTSGLDDFLFTPDMVTRSRDNFRTIKDYLPQLADDTLQFEPGTRWAYSNTGFLVLGAIVEKVSGMPYDEYVGKNVYAAAGMTNTGAPELDLAPKGLASAYEKEYVDGKPLFRNDRYSQVLKGTPAGGGYTTVTDLMNFALALKANKLLSSEMTAAMTSPKPELNSPGYGFGIQIFGDDYYGHTGGGPGTAAWLEINNKKNLIIVVLGNQSSGSNLIARKVKRLYAE